MHYEWDWEAAEKYFERALKENPNLAPPHSNYSVLCAYRGRYEEAINEALRGQELDPFSGWSNYCVAYTYQVQQSV